MKRQRPAGIWAVVILQIILALTLLPGVVANFPGVSPLAGVELNDIGRGIFLVWSILAVLSAIWLWTLSRRGWALTMVLVGIGLTANLVQWSLGDPSFARMATLAATAFYLNSDPVRQLFMRRDEVSRVMIRDTDDQP